MGKHMQAVLKTNMRTNYTACRSSQMIQCWGGQTLSCDFLVRPSSPKMPEGSVAILKIAIVGLACELPRSRLPVLNLWHAERILLMHFAL